MSRLDTILANNKKWIDSKNAQDGSYFSEMAKGQQPEYLWIGCADSRVSPAHLAGLEPGEVFVHRNVANVFYPNDTNLSAVIQYSVEVLKVKKVIVCGHYGCGGVAAALTGVPLTHVHDWIAPIREVIEANQAELDAIEDFDARCARLSELNALAQAENVKQFPSVANADHDLSVHAMIYGIADGELKEL